MTKDATTKQSKPILRPYGATRTLDATARLLIETERVENLGGPIPQFIQENLHGNEFPFSYTDFIRLATRNDSDTDGLLDTWGHLFADGLTAAGARREIAENPELVTDIIATEQEWRLTALRILDALDWLWPHEEKQRRKLSHQLGVFGPVTKAELLQAMFSDVPTLAWAAMCWVCQNYGNAKWGEVLEAKANGNQHTAAEVVA